MTSLKSIIAVAIAFVLFSIFVWEWGFCRFYVYPDQMAVITAKTGAALKPGQILAQEGQMGIQEQVLGEGRHFRNPGSQVVPDFGGRAEFRNVSGDQVLGLPQFVAFIAAVEALVQMNLHLRSFGFREFSVEVGGHVFITLSAIHSRKP